MKPYTFLLLLLMGSGAYAQYTNVLISKNKDPNETSIAINQKFPQYLVAGANLANVYRSSNGGLTWVDTVLTSSYGVWGDPVLFCDTNGHFYFMHLSNPANGSWIDRIVCQKSTDNGLTWSDGTYFGLNPGKQQDKHWAVVDPATNCIHVTWTEFDQYGSISPLDSSRILYVRSLDGGATWSTPIKINTVSGNCIDSDQTTEGAVPAVGPNGEVYVAWAGPSGIVFNRSLDKGITWGNTNIAISSQPGGWDQNINGIFRANGLPFTYCDLSNGPHRGTIYVCWTDSSAGNYDVYLSRSIDKGLTWSNPIRVNDDTTQAEQFFVSMALDQANGNLHILFYDRRNYNNLFTDVYWAHSTNGGVSFVNEKISDQPFLPSANVFFGDYTGIAAYNNKVRPIWTKMVGTKTEAHTALVQFNPMAIPITTTTDTELPTLYSNQQQNIISFKIRRPAQATLILTDMKGIKVKTYFQNKVFQPGRYQENIDINGLPSGYYLAELQWGQDFKTFKIWVP